jgi:hypothetical protein
MPKYKKGGEVQKIDYHMDGENLILKNMLLPITPQNFEIGSIEFERYCFNNHDYYMSPFAGKFQLLRYNFENLDFIINNQLKEKTQYAKIEINTDKYNQLKRQIEKMFYGGLVLEIESCCMQLVEMVLRLISSLQLNQDKNLFWSPFMFCNNKDSNIYSPKSIDGFLDSIYKSKDLYKAITNNFDYKYIFFANNEYSFIHNKSEYKVISKSITKILKDIISRFEKKNIYNQYKHGSRTYAKKIDLKLNLHTGTDQNSEIKYYSNLAPFTLFSTLKIDAIKNKIIEEVSISNIGEELDFCNHLMKIINHTIFIHNHKLFETGYFDESKIQSWW